MRFKRDFGSFYLLKVYVLNVEGVLRVEGLQLDGFTAKLIRTDG